MELIILFKKAKDGTSEHSKVSVAMKWKTRTSRDRSTTGRKSPRNDYSSTFRIMSLSVIVFRSISSALSGKEYEQFLTNNGAQESSWVNLPSEFDQ